MQFYYARAWRLAVPFFTSIEVWLMVLVAADTVGGIFLAAMGDGRALHAKGILSWPFL